MLSLVYVSSAVRKFTAGELVDLLEQSRENNTRLGVTGMLLYDDGNFMQVLEGPDETVRSLYETIAADPRHKRVMLLFEQPIEQRQFPDWSMAFRNLEDPATRNTPGYSEFMSEGLRSDAFHGNPARAWRLLEVFRYGTTL